MRWIGFALVLAALAGCTDDGDAASEASLAFDSDGEERDGVHSEVARCTDGASLNGAASIDEGNVHVTIADGDGNTVFDNSYDDAVDLEGELVDGADGDWQIKAERLNGFDGDYSFVLVCT